MEHFFRLPAEKQKAILDAAFSAFGANGYKKTSVSDIAAAAGISKAMVFRYFGTKKSLYLYLVERCGRTFTEEINQRVDRTETDFFYRILSAGQIELSIMEKHPGVFQFLNSVFFETDEAVKEEVQALLSGEEGEKFRAKIAFEGADTRKFKDGVDPKLVMKLLFYFTCGCLGGNPGARRAEPDALYRDFKDCVALLRNHLYREEFLNP